MSGCGYTNPCPRCGGTMSCYSDYKPYDIASGECLDCGFCYYTQEGQMTLEEVNDLRRDGELEPLTQLAKSIE